MREGPTEAAGRMCAWATPAPRAGISSAATPLSPVALFGWLVDFPVVFSFSCFFFFMSTLITMLGTMEKESTTWLPPKFCELGCQCGDC